MDKDNDKMLYYHAGELKDFWDVLRQLTNPKVNAHSSEDGDSL